MQLLEQTFLNNALQKWVLACAITFFGTLVLYIVSRILARSFAALDKRIPGDVARFLADTVNRTKLVVLLIASMYAGSKVLILPPALASVLRGLAIIGGFAQTGIWANFLVSRLVPYYVSRKGEGGEIVSAYGVLTLIARVVVWSAVFLLILDNLGFDITTLVAGLGVGGIAIAMAAQNVLSDLFASLSILLDKPFKVGEFIIVGDLLGVVEHIGLKTTRIRSLGGEQLVFSNTDLLSSRIRNYKTLQERRIVFTIGVEYSTPHEKVKAIPQMIKEIIESIENTRFDRSHFSSYGDFSLNFETVYYVLAPDYITYMDIQQQINLQLFKKFEEEGIAFAFPTRTIHLKEEVSGE
jgi:small-conductance mechanosensitive channel